MAFYSARVEYALHTVLNLHRAGPGATPSARELAAFQRLPLAFTRRLLTQLEKAGLVLAAEGMRGGWQLARPASAITVLDIADAARGPSDFFECRSVRERCALWPDGAAPRAATTGVCSIQSVMLRAESAARRELAATTIADLADQVRAKGRPRSADAAPVWFADRYARRRSGE